MESISYVIGGLNLILGIVIAIIRNNYDNILLARDQIKEQFFSAYMELSNNLGASSINVETIKLSAIRMKKLHYSSVSDIHLINIIDFFINKLITILLIFVIVVISSILAGNLINTDNSLIKITLLIAIPFLIFVIEILILILLLVIEKYLKNTANKYRNLDI